MRAVLYTGNPEKLNWAASGRLRILQNVLNLISTERYGVAYDRTLGIDKAFIDKPIGEAIPMIAAQIYDIVSAREPRAKVDSVDFIDVDEEGNMNFKVVIGIE